MDKKAADARVRTPLGQFLWRIRIDRQWTFAQMAEATGVNASTLCRLERERQTPRTGTLKSLAQGLECSLDSLRRLARAPLDAPSWTFADWVVDEEKEEERAEHIFELQQLEPKTRQDLEGLWPDLHSEDPGVQAAAITAVHRGMRGALQEGFRAGVALGLGLILGTRPADGNPYVLQARSTALQWGRAAWPGASNHDPQELGGRMGGSLDEDGV